VRESLTVDSRILGKSVRYSVYLPPDYLSSQRSYPVVYLLHGGGENETHMIRRGEVSSVVDRLVREGRMPTAIFVMPDSAESRWLNNHDRSVRYEDFFFTELIPHIQASYRAIDAKASRAIAGTSMGGLWHDRVCAQAS
jgi:enterochelin esterase-like enzyme